MYGKIPMTVPHGERATPPQDKARARRRRVTGSIGIGIFGTFDVKNYGDLLFPLIANVRLGRQFSKLQLHPVSPVGGAAVWKDAPVSTAYDQFTRTRQRCSGFLIGGGNIVRTTPTTLPSYNGILTPILAYPNLWAGVAAEDRGGDTPICWNAPGVSEPLPLSLRPMLRMCLEGTAYISVRDESSRDLLREVIPEREISIVPDTAWDLDKLWTGPELRAAYGNAFALRGTLVPDRSVAVHVNARYLGGATTEQVAARLDELCRALEAKGILIAVGPCHGDDDLARQIAAQMQTGPLLIDQPDSLREIAGCIAHSVAYIGSSMHGFITASVFCVPAVIVASPRMRKFPALLSQIGVPDVLHQNWMEAIEHLLAIVAADTHAGLLQIRREQQKRLDEHWSRITALFETGFAQRVEDSGTREPETLPLSSLYREALLGATLASRQTEAKEVAAKLQAEQARAADFGATLAAREAEAKEVAAKLQAEQARAAELVATLKRREAEAKQLAAKLQAQEAQTFALSEEVSRCGAKMKELAARLKAQRARISGFRSKLVARQRALRALEGSTSWRVTRPVRVVSHALRLLRTDPRLGLVLVWWLATGQFGRAAKAVRPKSRPSMGAPIKPRDGKTQLRPKKRQPKNRDTVPVSAAGTGLAGAADGPIAAVTIVGEPPKARPKDILRNAIAEAAAASQARDWAEAVGRWQAVLEEFGDRPGVAAEAKFNISTAHRLAHIDAYKERIAEYASTRAATRSGQNAGNKIVVYTSVSVGYDSIKLPELFDSRVDYVLFTDRPAPDTGIYQVQPITYFHEDAARAARFVKTHPHLLLGNCDVAVWVDASFMICGEIYPIIESFMASRKPVGAVRHSCRTSVYEEFEACIQRNKDHPDILEEQERRYRAMAFDTDDLIETGLMMFNLRDCRTRQFLDLWWGQIDRFSKRDQLSVNYALKQTGLDWHRIAMPPVTVRNHPNFVLAPHDAGTGPASALISALEATVVDPYQGTSYADVREQRIDAQQNCRIDVVICVHNALDDVKQCLESVRGARRGENQRLILIDDGSDEPTAKFLSEFASTAAWVELHRSETASGYTKAANRGLSLSTGELVILLNSDTVVTDGWAEKMADAVFSTPGAGIVGPISNAGGHQSIPEHRSSKEQTAVNDLPPGLTSEDMNRRCEQWTVEGILPRVPLVHGFCFGLTRAVIDRIGFFDEANFPRGYGEENDYCFRAADAGFGHVVATHTYVFHAKSKSYGGGRLALAKAGSETLLQLHGRGRIERAVKSTESNSVLASLRGRAALLWQCEPGEAISVKAVPIQQSASAPVIPQMRTEVNMFSSRSKATRESDAGVLSSADFVECVNANGFEFVDFGCSHGGSIEHAKKLFGAKKGLGIDISRQKIESATANGFDAVVFDIHKIPEERLFRFATMCHFLEHVPDMNDVRAFVEKACRISKEFVFIKQPFFDADPYLFRMGLKLFWSDWRGHPNRMSSLELALIGRDLKAKGLITSYGVYAKHPIKDSSDRRIHPVNSPVDQHEYDVKKHLPKPMGIAFEQAIYAEAVAVYVTGCQSPDSVAERYRPDCLAYHGI